MGCRKGNARVELMDIAVCLLIRIKYKHETYIIGFLMFLGMYTSDHKTRKS